MERGQSQSEATRGMYSFASGGDGDRYDVFLSFRGSDTRNGFTDYLYRSLINVGALPICVFKDDESLPIGEEFGSQLLNAITRSKISIPIISENYASSRWCLRELVHIMEYKKSTSHIVLPIFYKVDASDVRYLKGSFGMAFDSHKERFDVTDIEKGRQALTEVSYLKGWESAKFANGREGELVEKVVETVLSELRRDFQLDVTEYLVGIGDHMKAIWDWAHTSTNDARTIGIYGMGGIGKTTLAKVIYNKLSSEFMHHSFLQDIRERARGGIHHVQNQLIKDIQPNHQEVQNVDNGINTIRYMLKGKKVLILLDDIDDKRQLDVLARKQNWFTSGSIIIVTTRNKFVLDQSELEILKYELDELDKEHSLCLFNRHAFRMGHPSSNFEGISRDIISTTGGLPLALEVIGSYLYGETNQKVWNDLLKQLKKQPHKDVQKTLKISYDALAKEEQEIFLDIGCFFIDKESKYAMYMWDGCEFYANKSIRELKQRCLIKIDGEGRFKMHDQLRDLARSIVCEGKLPENRSRLWDEVAEEAVNVLQAKKGTEKIRAMSLSEKWHGPFYPRYTNEEFKNLPSLRFLQLGHNFLYGDFGTSFSELRWLQCYCPANLTSLSLPAIKIYLPKLVVLQFSPSDYEVSTDDWVHWDGWSSIMLAKQLKVLELRDWTFDFTLDFSECPKLEILSLKGFSKPEQLHPSIGTLECLVSLHLDGCSKLRELPKEIGFLRKLERLSAKDCWSLREIPSSFGNLSSLHHLYLTNCLSLKEIPNSFGNLSSLQHLDLCWCSSLREIPDSFGNLSFLQHLDLCWCSSLIKLPSSFENLSSLQHLYLTGCSSLRELPSSFGNLSSLQQLNLSYCESLREIPTSFGNLYSLQHFHLTGCSSLRELPSLFGNLCSLQELNLCFCKSLRELPSSFGNLCSIQHLYLSNCESLREIITSFGNLSSLQHLDLSYCRSLREIPTSFGNLSSLQQLNLSYCSKLTVIPDSIGDLWNLQLLDARDCRIEKIPHSIGKLKKLQHLCITCDENTGIPLEIGDLSSLQELDLGCPLKIGSETELPSGFTHSSLSSDGPTLPWLSSLIHLQQLHLSNYKFLEHIPELPSTLQRLSLSTRPKVQLPELDRLNHLERLSLIKCDDLNEIQALADLESLEEIILERCRSIQRLILPKCLKTLEATYCDNLVDIRSHGDMDSLKLMDISSCGSIQTLILPKLQSLEEFRAASCDKLVEIRGLDKAEFLENLNLSKCVSIERLPDLSCFATLKRLDISGCRLLHDVEILGRLQSLEEFTATSCDKLVEIRGLDKAEFLENLDLSKCVSIERLPNLSCFATLKKLDISGCRLLHDVEILGRLQSLEEFSAASCDKLVEIQGLDKAKFLEKLNISECVSIERLPYLSCFDTLKELDIHGCRLLHDVEILGRFLSCQKIFIRDCESLEKLPNLSKFEYLREFTIINSLLVTKIPGIGESRSLTEITIARCQSLETLPDLSGCENLQSLTVAECEKLTRIQGLPKSDNLRLVIYECYSLKLPELPQERITKFDTIFRDHNSIYDKIYFQ